MPDPFWTLIARVCLYLSWLAIPGAVLVSETSGMVAGLTVIGGALVLRWAARFYRDMAALR